MIRKLISEVVREAFVERPYGIGYTAAVVEDESDRQRLIDVTEQELSKRGLRQYLRWKQPPDHHMTICLGELPLRLKMRGDIGSDVELTITHFGVGSNAVALKVTGYMSKNDIQHITMFYRVEPAHSKGIIKWMEVEPFTVSAIIREVPNSRP